MRLGALLILLTLFVQAPAWSWTLETERRIALQAIELAPPDLRLLIQAFPRQFEQGLLEASLEEEQSALVDHLIVRKGTLAPRIESEVAASIRIVKQQQSMAEFVHRLGVLSHLISDANHPFHVNDSDPRLDSCRRDFEAYAERRSSRFPIVFYGLDPQFRLKSYLSRTTARSSGYYPLLGAEYFRHGTRRSSAEFDDRSTAFGIASLSVSHSVTDVVNLYYYIWKEAGGDVRSAERLRPGVVLRRDAP